MCIYGKNTITYLQTLVQNNIYITYTYEIVKQNITWEKFCITNDKTLTHTYTHTHICEQYLLHNGLH